MAKKGFEWAGELHQAEKEIRDMTQRERAGACKKDDFSGGAGGIWRAAIRYRDDGPDLFAPRISKGMMYHYFSSKDELFSSLR